MKVIRINLHQRSPLATWAADIWHGNVLICTGYGDDKSQAVADAVHWFRTTHICME